VRIIGGQWKRTRLPVADKPGLRPTPDRVRETLFNWLGQDLVFLDPPFDANLVEKALAAAVPALRPGGWLYLEAQHKVTEASLEAHGLELVRHLKAGAVHAHLLRTPEPTAIIGAQPPASP
jgi:16S rRNA G966 N2-methylase RsmD